MKVLLTRPASPSTDELGAALCEAGHRVVRCSDNAADEVPCRSLHDEPCPLDTHGAGADAVVVERQADGTVAAADAWGVACALRARLPVVLVGSGGGDPLDRLAVASLANGDQVVDALPGLAARRVLDLEGPAAAEAARLLAASGQGDVAEVEVRRHGRDLHASIALPREVDESERAKIAVRVLAQLRRRDRWSERIDVSTTSTT